VIKASACIEASFKRGKGEVGMDEYQVRTWQGWHHHMALSLMAIWFLIDETHRGQQLTPALTLPQVRYGLSLLLLEVYYTPGVDYICRQQLVLFHASHNFCLPPASGRVPLAAPLPTHGTGSARQWQPRTPAMAAGLTDHVWTLREVLLCRVPPWPQPAGV
jgi:hypothetical protein